MTDTIDNILNQINILETEKYQNMTVIGLNIPDKQLDLMSLEIGLDMGLVEITELNEQGSVGEVKVTNNAVTPLLLLDGEEILGSKQNRIINTTIIIPAKSEKIIPVSCVEANRWDYNTRKFHYSNNMATSRVRRDKLNSINQSLRKTNRYISDQNKVWENISQTEMELGVNSTTSALHDTYIQRDNTIQEYKKAFKIQQQQNGRIVYINGELAGFEIIYNSTRYKQYHDKLLKSYIIDAISKQQEDYVEEYVKKEDLINKIRKSKRETYESIGLGTDYRFEDEDIMGSMMLLENDIINASFFKKTTV